MKVHEMTASHRVVAKFRQRLADLVGDPDDLFRKLTVVKEEMDGLQYLLPIILKGEDVIRENYRYRWNPPPELKDTIQRLNDAETTLMLNRRKILGPLGEVCGFIFLALLQKYSLPAGVRKKVEAQARLWGRKNSLKFKGLESEVFLSVKGLVDTAYEVAKEALAVGTETIGSKAEVPVGSFKLINTGGFPDKIMLGVKEALEKAEHLLRAKGLGRVCYGEVYVTRTIKSSALAFYVFNQDALFVRANFRKAADLVYNILHELAHRLDYKFLKDKKAEKNKFYRDLNTKARFFKPDVEFPALGDPIKIKNKDYIVDRIGWRQIYIRPPDAVGPSSTYITLDQYSKLKAREKGEAPFGDEGFVTEYASKSPEENFAETVTHYCLGKLSPKLLSGLEAIIS